MKYGVETINEVIEEINPLLHAHWREIAKYQDIPLVPDWEAYSQIEKMGILKIFTCREEETNQLIGYCVYIVKPHLHYSTCLTAMQDILFIRQDRRGTGLRFIVWCDNMLKDMGVDLIIQHVKHNHNFGPALERVGYELMDLIYTKRIS